MWSQGVRAHAFVWCPLSSAGPAGSASACSQPHCWGHCWLHLCLTSAPPLPRRWTTALLSCLQAPSRGDGPAGPPPEQSVTSARLVPLGTPNLPREKGRLRTKRTGGKERTGSREPADVHLGHSAILPRWVWGLCSPVRAYAVALRLGVSGFPPSSGVSETV